MGYLPHGAAAAHAAKRRRLFAEQEEEEMTNYSNDDLNNNWEFKIVRSETDIFRRPEVFQQLLAEEQIAGWEMVEKLDDRRVRFKRNKDARRRDIRLPEGYDPYRTTYGRSNFRLVFSLLAMSISIAAILFAMFMENQGNDPAEWALTIPIIIILVIVFIMKIVTNARRR